MPSENQPAGAKARPRAGVSVKTSLRPECFIPRSRADARLSAAFRLLVAEPGERLDTAVVHLLAGQREASFWGLVAGLGIFDCHRPFIELDRRPVPRSTRLSVVWARGGPTLSIKPYRAAVQRGFWGKSHCVTAAYGFNADVAWVFNADVAWVFNADVARALNAGRCGLALRWDYTIPPDPRVTGALGLFERPRQSPAAEWSLGRVRLYWERDHYDFHIHRHTPHNGARGVCLVQRASE